MAKRGRRPSHYVTSDGETVVGLARRPSDGRWRIIGTNVTFSESDEKLAVFRFRQWQRGQSKEFITFSKPLSHKELDDEGEFRERVRDFGTFVMDKDGAIATESDVPSDVVWAKLRVFIIRKPLLAAKKLGIPEIAYIQDLPRPELSPSLDNIGKLYFDKAGITEHERRKSRLFWDEFKKMVGIETVRELSADRVAEYHDAIRNADQSQTYVKHRFGKIKTILRFAQTRGAEPVEIERALSLCKILQPPRATAADPHPISRDDFEKLLAAASEKWTAAILCALNFCMYAKEVAMIEKHDLDLKERTLVTHRGKTGVTRVAVLWPRTAKAIRKISLQDSSYLLVSSTGAPYHSDHVRRNFDRLRKKAGVADSVKFEDLRDGAYTTAVQGKGVEFEMVRILAGHRTGMSGHYIKRNPKLVAAACRAVEKSYFG